MQAQLFYCSSIVCQMYPLKHLHIERTCNDPSKLFLQIVADVEGILERRILCFCREKPLSEEIIMQLTTPTRKEASDVS